MHDLNRKPSHSNLQLPGNTSWTDDLYKRLELNLDRVSLEDQPVLDQRIEETLRASEKANRLLKNIAIAANSASSPDEALQVAVEQICEYMDWPVGHAYLTDPDGSSDLVSGDIWYLADPDRYQAIVDVTCRTNMALNVGLPGRVKGSKRPDWIEDVSGDQNFPRFAKEPDIGVCGAFAFPVLVDQEVVAVLEFFSEQPAPRDQALLDLLAPIGQQLGIVVQRHQSQIELKNLHSSLIDAARQAGQSEVATGVLHNVANVLNSVNVSAGIIQQKVRASSVASLLKAIDIMQEHRDDLGNYITQDERGKHLPQFLVDVSEQIDKDEQLVLEEIHSLIDNIDHIKAIVGAQQAYATHGSEKSGGNIEKVSLIELIENAIDINTASMSPRSVKVCRQFDDIGSVFIDKQKLLQIVVNLISNAKNACLESGKSDHQLTIRLRRSEEGQASIEVQDNGIGIDPENLTRIFSHGFTTREKGHGFGLHSASLAAQQLGGSLTVHSDGLGTGATFVLDMPFQRKGMSQ